MIDRRITITRSAADQITILAIVWAVRELTLITTSFYSGGILGKRIQNHDDDQQHDTSGEKRMLVLTRCVSHLDADIRGKCQGRVKDRLRDGDGVAQNHDDRHGLPYRPAYPQDDGGNYS